ncbi:hypothetical protein ACQPXS_32935 [Streptomyces sp. CA-142005]|uniref:hypothetical protein n=1 Tax=Streptomyces sp. CA-142005 TaxID=3240052 RepID=UPI003D8A50A5
MAVTGRCTRGSSEILGGVWIHGVVVHQCVVDGGPCGIQSRLPTVGVLLAGLRLGFARRVLLDALAAEGRGTWSFTRTNLGAVGQEANILYDDVKSQADIVAAGSGNGSTGSTMQAAATLKSHG